MVSKAECTQRREMAIPGKRSTAPKQEAKAHIFLDKTGGQEKNSHSGRIPREAKKHLSWRDVQMLKACRKGGIRKLNERCDLNQKDSSPGHIDFREIC